MKLRIGTDIDEVLSDFIGAYRQRFGEQPSHIITKHCERVLSHDRDFWVNLKLLRRPDFDFTLYCTKRVNPKSYTKEFIRKNNLPNAPIYQQWCQIGPKSRLIKGRVDVFIDDSVRNYEELNSHGVPCLLMDTPDNKNIDTPLRIYSLNYDEIERVYNKNFKTA